MEVIDDMTEISIGRALGNGEFTIDVDTLTKHAIVLGATGSGKTVLCKAIVEELALAGYPIVAIDPKGDISTLAIASEDFEFRPWSDVEAEELGEDPEKYSKKLKEKYLAEIKRWNIPKEKISRYVNDVRVIIYTPRSNYGVPLSIKPNLDPLPNFNNLIKENPSIAYDVIDSTVSLLIRLAGYSEKNTQEHALLSKIVECHWINGESIDLETLVEEVINPPFSKIGSLSIDAFLPERSRLKLARNLNVLLSHPAYKVWLEGEPIDFDKYFYAKGQISVIDLRFMTTMDEKQFFVGALLNELYRWLLRKGGVSSLRFLLYFDELVGFAPPISKPPSKTTLLLLVKQGRAFGLGCLLATQNPSDVDYKLLSNANHRFIGRLSTRQDVDKVRKGLELTIDAVGTIMRLKPRTFLYHNYEVGRSEIIEVRWLMTYHRGPLRPEEIRKIMEKYAPSKQEALKDRGSSGKVFEMKRDENKESVLILEESTEGEKKSHYEEEENIVEVTSKEQILAFKPRISPKELIKRLEQLNLKILNIQINTFKSPVYEVKYQVSLSLGSKSVEHRGTVSLLYDKGSFRRLHYDMDVVDLNELTILNEYPTREVNSLEDTKALVDMLKSKFKIRAFYSPVLRTVVFSRKELENLKERAREHIINMMNKEIENVDLEAKIRREEILHELPIIEAELKLKESDYKLVRARAEEISRLKEELKRRRIRLGTLTNEYRRIQKEQRALEAEIAKLKSKIKLMKEELEALESISREKIEFIKRKYRAMLNNAIVELTISPELRVRKKGYVIKMQYVIVLDVNGIEKEVLFDPYSNMLVLGRCEVCGREVSISLIGLEQSKKLPICSVCGAVLCSHHMLSCSVCEAILCPKHAKKCDECGVILCPRHTNHCYICGKSLCPEHTITCAVCGRKVCKEHAVLCVNKPVYVCTNCVVYKRKFFKKVPYCPI